MGERLEILPALGMVVDVVIDIAVGGGPLGSPIVLVMPVGLGEIETGPQSLSTEGIDDVESDVGLGIAAVGAFGTGNTIVGFSTAEHTKAIVVLGGENHIFHACFLGGGSHLVGMETGRVESLVEFLVSLLILHIGHALTVDPGLVADAPRLHNAPLGIDAPMHHESELEILPLVDAVEDDGVGFGKTVALGKSGATHGTEKQNKKRFLHIAVDLISKELNFKYDAKIHFFFETEKKHRTCKLSRAEDSVPSEQFGGASERKSSA